MGETSIEWTDKTWNPVTGCTKVSAGCKNCYAERVFPRPYGGICRKCGAVEEHHRWHEGIAPLQDHAFEQRKFTDVQTHPDRLDQPLRWRKPQRVFVNSMSDLFHEDVPDQFIAAVFGVMSAAMEHSFQVLTKRPKRMLDWSKWIDSYGGIGKYIRSDEGRAALRVIVGNPDISKVETIGGRRLRTSDDPWAKVMNAAACVGRGAPLPSVWLGVSVEDQKTADERIPLLLQTPAAVRFVSYEPALGPVDFIPYIGGRTYRCKCGFHRTENELNFLGGNFYYCHACSERCVILPGVDWVIVGGESGPGARPFNIQWARDVIAQCKAAGVAVFCKQLGSAPMLKESVGAGTDTKVFRLQDRKGGAIEEWPADLRVREFPDSRQAALSV